MLKNICGYLFYKYKQQSEEEVNEEKSKKLSMEEISDDLYEKLPENLYEELFEEFSEELSNDPEFTADVEALLSTTNEYSYDTENLINSYLLQIKENQGFVPKDK